jgi:hypothetical protein
LASIFVETADDENVNWFPGCRHMNASSGCPSENSEGTMPSLRLVDSHQLNQGNEGLTNRGILMLQVGDISGLANPIPESLNFLIANPTEAKVKALCTNPC